MKQKFFQLICVVITTLLLLLGLELAGGQSSSVVARPVMAAGSCPTIQNTPDFTIIYGDVTLNGQPTPAGTVITARSPRGDTVGCYVVNSNGYYGFMYVYGEDNKASPPIPGMRANEPITFFVDDVPATATPALNWTGAMDFYEVDLAVTITPAAANFSAATTTGAAPLTVNFTNQSTGDYDTCSWTFGDGGTSNTCINPSHTYTGVGTYSVSLTISGIGGSDTVTKTNYITVYEPVTANFSGTPLSGSAPLLVSFSNLSSGAYTSCTWNFGDGATSTSCGNQNHTFASSGTYTVTLTTSGPGGSDTETKASYVTTYQPVQADFNANPTSGVAALAVNFTNLSTGSFSTCSWNFGDGGVSTNCSNPAHTYTSSGTYAVSLAVSGAGGTNTVTKNNLITVYQPVQADFSGSPTSGNYPLTVNFSNLSAGDYTACAWTFGDGSTSANCSNPSHSYTAAGQYSVTLSVSGPGGTQSKTRTNYVLVSTPAQPVVANFDATPKSGSNPLIVNFTNTSSGDFNTCLWNFGDGSTNSTCNNPSHTFTSAGVYTVTLTASGAGGNDSETKTSFITVYQPVTANFSSTPTSGVAPLNVNFSNLSTGAFSTCSWNFGDGGVSISCGNPAHTFVNAGIYTVTLTASGNGGSDTEAKTNLITVYAPVQANFTANPTSGIAPLSVNFTNQSTGDYNACTWTFGDGNSLNSCSNPSHSYSGAGTYSVSLTVSGSGGSNTQTKTNYISASAPAENTVASFSATPTSGVKPVQVQFTDTSTGSPNFWFWSFGDGGTSSSQNPLHTYSTTGVYTVSLITNGPNGMDTETKAAYIAVYDPMKASFTADVTSGSIPLTVRFTNKSTGNINLYIWNFGDGTLSYLTHPTHTYVTTGTFSVGLTVSGPGGSDSMSATDLITASEGGSFVYIPIILK